MASKVTLAIGDIHGMVRPFRALLMELTRVYPASDTRFIFLGDLIDRGLGSFQVMEDLSAFFEDRPSSALILGNHDEFFLLCLQGQLTESQVTKWMSNGGVAALKSYAFDEDCTLEEVRKTINLSFPRHLKLLERAVPMVLTDRHCFVHAGVNPTRALTDQDDCELRWIRKGFLDYEGMFEKIVVHGHSITETGFPEVRQNRIALDTGSYKTGRISAAIFEDDALVGFLCAQIVGEEVVLQCFDAGMNEIQTTSGHHVENL